EQRRLFARSTQRLNSTDRGVSRKKNSAGVLALAGLWPVVNIVRSHAEPAVREIIVPRRKAGHDKPCGHLTSRRDQINTNPSCSVPINDAKTGAGKLGSSSLTDRYSRPLLEVFFQAAPNSD